MTKLFPTQFDVPTGTITTSNEIVMEAAGTFTVIDTGVGATLVVNGSVVGTTAVVAEDDRVAVRMLSSGEHAYAKHAVVSLDGVESAWTVVTESDPSIYANPLFFDLDLYQIERDAQGVEYVPYSVYNRALMYDAGGEAGSVSIYSKVEVPSPAVDSTFPISIFYDKRVQIFGSAERRVIRTVDVDGTPFQAVYVPRDPTASNPVYDLWTTVSNGARIDVFGPDYEKAFEIPTGKRPTGIAVSADGRHVWAANSDDNTVLHLSYVNGAWVPTTISVAANPLYIAVDNMGRAYVSCAASERVVRIAVDNTVDSIDVGVAPRGIYCDNNVVWVALFGEGAVRRIEGTTAGPKIEVGMSPYSVGKNIAGNIVVGCMADSEVYEIDPNTNQVEGVETVTRLPYLFGSVGNVFLTLALWQGTPKLVYQKDQEPFRYKFDSPDEVQRNALIRTNRFRIQGINVETQASVAPILNSTLVKNGSVVGNSTTVVNGDTLQVNYTSPSQPEVEIELELVVGTGVGSMYTQTTSIDLEVDAFDIPALLNAELGVEYTSDEVTIGGLEQPALLSITSGILIKNGTALDTIATEVFNGDKIRIRMTSAATNSTPVFTTLTIGAFEEVWSIFTKAEAGSSVYMPAIDAGKTMFDLIDFNSLGTLDPLQDMLYRYNASTMGAPIEYAVTNAEVNNGSASKENLYVMDAARKRVVFMDVDDNDRPGVERIYNVGGMPYGITAGPMVAMGKLPTNQYVTVYDRDRVVKLGTNVSLPLISGAKPMGIACSNYNIMYVAGDDGFLHVFNYDETAQEFEFNTIMGVPTGGRLCDVMFDDTSLFVSDLTSGSVHKLVSGFYVETVKVGHLPYAMAQSDTHVFTANFGSASISKFPKTNGSSSVMTVNLPAGASQPTSIAVDKARNRVFVACSRESRIYELNADTLAVTRVVNTLKPVWGLQMRDTSLMAVALWGNLLELKGVGAVRTAPTSLVFNPQLDVDLDTWLTSNRAQVVQNLVLPEEVWVEPFTDVSLMKNGVNVGHSTTVVRNDRIEIVAKSPNSYESARSVHLYSYKHHAAFEMLTTIDVFPDLIVFPTVQNAIVKDMVESDEMEVSGLAAGVSVQIVPKVSAGTVADTELQLFKNGVLLDLSATNTVKNGDKIRMVLRVVNVAWNGNSLVVTLNTDRDFQFGTFSILTAYLDGAVRPPNGWMHDYSNNGVIEHGYHHSEQLEGNADVELLPAHIAESDVDRVGDTAISNVLHEVLDGVGYELEAMQSILEIAVAIDAERAAHGTETSVAVDGYDLIEASNTEVEVDGYGRVTAQTNEVAVNGYGRVTAQTNEVEVDGYGRGEDNAATLVEVDGYFQVALHGLRDGGFAPESGGVISASGSFKTSSVQDWTAGYTDSRHDVRTTVSMFARSAADKLVKAEYDRSAVVHLPEVSAVYKLDNYFTVSDVESKYKLDNRYTTAKVNASYVDSKHMSFMLMDTFWRQGVVRAYHGVDTLWVSHRTLHQEAFGASVEKLNTRALFPTAAGYEVGKRIHIHNIGVAGYERPSLTRFKLSGDRQFVRPANITHEDYQYTAAWERAFDSEETAIEAGMIAGHPTVYGKQLYDNFWMWHIPGLVTRVECANTSLRPTVVWGYVQGG